MIHTEIDGDSAASQAVDRTLNESSVEQPTSSLPASLTQRTFDRYLADAIGHPDPLRGALGLINSFQMRLASTYSGILEQGMQRVGNSWDSLRQVQAPISVFLQVTRQIERIADLEVRVTHAKNRQSDTYEFPRAAPSPASPVPQETIEQEHPSVE